MNYNKLTKEQKKLKRRYVLENFSHFAKNYSESTAIVNSLFKKEFDKLYAHKKINFGTKKGVITKLRQ